MLKRGSVLSVCIAVLFTLLVGCTGTDKAPEELDLSKYPFYREDFADMQYTFTEDETVAPYWKGNIIYNESIMPIDYGTEISAKLEYAPLKVISVRDYTLKHEYKEGEDYTVSGNKIVVLENSQIPRLTEDNLKGKDIPEPYRRVDSITKVETDYVLYGANVIYTEGSLIYGHQLFVTYAYDVRDLNMANFTEYKLDKLPSAKQKLQDGESLTFAIIGSSTGEGCSSSSFFKREPFMDNFITLATKGIEKHYSADINLVNLSKGGTTVVWGQERTRINSIVEEQPDVLFIVFGTNECNMNMSPADYKDNMMSLVLQVRESLPDCEVVIFNMFTPNPVSYDLERLEKYWQQNNSIEQTIGKTAVIDLYDLSVEMLKTKKYMDVTGNGINHINDYSSRLYAMSVMSAFIEY